jgi:hypothetical protein
LFGYMWYSLALSSSFNICLFVYLSIQSLFFSFSFFFFLVVLEYKVRTLRLPGKLLTTWATPVTPSNLLLLDVNLCLSTEMCCYSWTFSIQTLTSYIFKINIEKLSMISIIFQSSCCALLILRDRFS